MAEKELKWYGILAILFGTVISIADPITDILTLVEFYRANHKTWFGVGLCFITFAIIFFFSHEFLLRERRNLVWLLDCMHIWLPSIFSRFCETENAFCLPEEPMARK